MNINGITNISYRTEVSSSTSKTRLTEPASTAPAVRSGGTSELLTLTPAALTLSAARDGAGTVPFNEEKVASIRAAIAEGRYPAIDNKKLAQQILDSDLDFAPKHLFK
ncbi:flagellar biosynthesis anti-sigma factor FlgM [Chromatium okenii]|uniref:flagellar biosynthesis anti-sigma factor FlgM n=1 Tax=Chromatium okenii TaxID=61644 RepID=UPI001908B011|nr:flagellar biosynthesis anti-sigma factor FlgM [Chromatium okenii]MBK1641080.1 flagellar biosynthesis anti-sigma factor FlgM [Chromatium okenii]